MEPTFGFAEIRDVALALPPACIQALWKRGVIGMAVEDESARLRSVAQQTRLRTIQTELSLAFTWCSVARTEAQFGEEDRFQKSLQRLKRAIESLRTRIHEPEHVPMQLVPQFEAQLEQLESKVFELQEELG